MLWDPMYSSPSEDSDDEPEAPPEVVPPAVAVHASAAPAANDNEDSDSEEEVEVDMDVEAPKTAHAAPQTESVPRSVDGFALHLSSRSATGYAGVEQLSNGLFRASHWTREGAVQLGRNFATAEQAAAAYARHLQNRAESIAAAPAAAAEPPPPPASRTPRDPPTAAGPCVMPKAADAPPRTFVSQTKEKRSVCQPNRFTDASFSSSYAHRADRPHGVAAKRACMRAEGGVGVELPRPTVTNEEGGLMPAQRNGKQPVSVHAPLPAELIEELESGSDDDDARAPPSQVALRPMPVAESDVGRAPASESAGPPDERCEQEGEHELQAQGALACPPAVVPEYDGVKLHLSSTSRSGYRAVHKAKNRFYVQLWDKQAKTMRRLPGTYATAVEAAAAFARHLMLHPEHASYAKPEGPAKAKATDPDPAPPGTRIDVWYEPWASWCAAAVIDSWRGAHGRWRWRHAIEWERWDGDAQVLILSDEQWRMSQAPPPTPPPAWRTDGSAYVGQRVLFQPKGCSQSYGGVVVGWVPAEDGRNGMGEPVALWHVQHDDGDEEDLEEHEVGRAIAAWAARAGAQATTCRSTTLALAPAPEPVAASGAPATAADVQPAASPGPVIARAVAAPAPATSTIANGSGSGDERRRASTDTSNAAGQAAGSVGALLERTNLVQYVALFDENGFDDLAFLREMEPRRLEELLAKPPLHMKVGHAARFVYCLHHGFR